MINTVRIIVVLAIYAFFTSCTDVIDVEVSEAAPRLVIEASLNWEKGTAGNTQSVKLSTSTPYFNNTISNIVTGALVTVTDVTNGTDFIFTDQNNGVYTTSNFIPVVNHAYTLEVIYDGDTYIAEESLRSVVDIEDVYQTIEKGFDDEALEVNIDFNDPADEENYYFIKIEAQDNLLPVLFSLSDEFTNGNLTSVYYERLKDTSIHREKFIAGDSVAIEFYGVSEQYYNYVGLLIDQYNSVGNPFSSTPVPLKGNCINITDPENYAFGYFRLTQVVNKSYTFE